MISAFLFCSAMSVKNRILHRLRRLKQPRYVVSMVLALAWFGFMFSGNRGPRGKWDLELEPIAADLPFLIITVIATLLLLVPWSLPHTRAALPFSDAEIQFLFPAPVSRRGIVGYKVLRSQPAIFFTAAVMWFASGRIIHFHGLWIAFCALDIYLMMVSFASARLRLAKIGWLLRVVVFALAVGGILAVVSRQIDHPALGRLIESDPKQAWSFAKNQFSEFPLNVIFFIPSRFAVLLVASEPLAAAGATLTALGMAALFFIASTVLDVSWEDASIEASRRKAERLERMQNVQAGRHYAFRRMRPPFALAAAGPPDIAIVWKNVAAAGRMSLPVFGGIALLLVVAAAILAIFSEQRTGWITGGATSLALSAVMLLFGPLIFRNDLRDDVLHLDVLKSLPIESTRLVVAEILAPAVLILLCSLGYLLLGGIFFFFAAPLSAWLKVAAWIPAGFLIAFLFALIQLTVQNGLVVLLPGWANVSAEQARGFEATGRGLLLMMTNLLAILVAGIPAALAFAVGFWIAGFRFGYGPIAATIAAVPAAMLLLGELRLAIRFLGSQFESLDVANDLGRG